MAAVNRRAAARRLALRTGLLAAPSLIALALPGASPARAQTTQWNGAKPGNWFTAGNWSSGRSRVRLDTWIGTGSAVIERPARSPTG